MNLPESARGERLDRAIAACFEDASVREIRLALERGGITVNGRRRAPGEKAEGGETIDCLDFIPRKQAQPVADPSLAPQVEVLHQDEHLLVLNKPSGIPTAPLRPGETGTLLAAAIALAPEVGRAGPPLEGGLAHRLDTGTSGVVLFAKDSATWDALRADFGAHRIEKRYRALVWGHLEAPTTLTAAIGPGPSKDRVRVGESPRAQWAETKVQPIETAPGVTLVEAQTSTGRRHQIRAHLADAGFPLLGDRLYGPEEPGPLDRLALHAQQLTLPDGRRFTAPDPPSFAEVLARLRGSTRA